jgi:hypothetical protein
MAFRGWRVACLAFVLLAPLLVIPVDASAAVVPGWEIVATPDNTQFRGAAAVSADDAWLVGRAGGPSDAVAYHWDGTSWTLSPSVFEGNPSELYAVDALTSSNVWAVGGHDCCPFSSNFDGSGWTSHPIPGMGGALDVGIVSATDAWAVGFVDGAIGGVGMHTPAYARWNGTAWSGVAPSFTVGAVLTSVEVRSSTDIWAGGFRVDVDADPRIFMTHFNGSSWSQVSLPDVGIGQIEGIVAFSSSSAYAVGWQGAPGEPRQTLVLNWNGATWSTDPSPDVTTLDNELTAVDGTSETDIWAVGSTRTDEFHQQTLSIHRDASGWSVVPTPNPSASSSASLTTVAAPAPDAAFAGDTFIASFGPEVLHDSSLQISAGFSNWGYPIPIQGALTLSGFSFAGQRDISILRASGTSEPIEVGTAQTGNDGSFTFADKPPAQGQYTYTARFLGDATWDGSDSSDVGKMNGIGTRVGLRAPNKIRFGETATLIAHLGRRLDSDVLTIYSKRPNQEERVVAQGSVNADGELRVRVHPSVNTMYEARFAGDTKFSPSRSGWKVVGVVPIFSAKAVNRDGTDGAYAVYRYDQRCPGSPHQGCPTVAGHLKPAHPGHKVFGWLQVQVDGIWRSGGTFSAKLNSRSRLSLAFFYRDRKVVGLHLRVRYFFEGDKDHLVAKSPWVYFVVR